MKFSQQKVLIVEDNENLGQTLNEYLNNKGLDCQLATTIKEAKEAFARHHFEIILLDIGLPDGNGIDLAKEWKSSAKDFVLFFLSAQNDPQTRFDGLDLGAHDYITKPFDLRELVLRLQRELGQRNISTELQDIHIGPLLISFDKYRAIGARGEEFILSAKECAIMQMLYENLNQVVTRDDIIEKVWGVDQYPSNRTVDNYIVKLRKWLDTDENQKASIKSIRGVGYQFLTK